VSLFQRIKTPFDDQAEDILAQPGDRLLTVGVLLRERREELGFDLDTIGEALRIKPIYLAALEQGRAQDLPGATYAIGFIRAYAQLLDLDSERILDSYKAECAEMHARPDLALPVALGARSVPGGPILLVGVILALCGYGTWYYLSTSERSRPERVAAVPADLQRVAQGTMTPLPGGTAPAPSRPAPAPVSGAVAGLGASSGTASPGPRLSSGLLAPPDLSASLSLPASGPPSPPLTPGVPNPGPPGPVSPGVGSPSPGSPSLGSPSLGSPGAGSAVPPNQGIVAKPAAAAPPGSTAVVASAKDDTARPTPSNTAEPTGDAGVKPDGRIDIRAVADCWIQVRAADRSIVFSRVLKAGETYHVPRAGLSLRTGNAGGLAIAVDGKPAPTIGAIGTLRRNVVLEPEALLAGTAVQG
jgi:cytoskeleton protein RodZ